MSAAKTALCAILALAASLLGAAPAKPHGAAFAPTTRIEQAAAAVGLSACAVSRKIRPVWACWREGGEVRDRLLRSGVGARRGYPPTEGRSRSEALARCARGSSEGRAV